MNLDVSRKPIADILALLKKGEWQVPKFQREFIWRLTQVEELLKSIFRARPIGMVTIWSQPQDRPLTQPEPLRLKAQDFKDFEKNPPVLKLILDGKQRLTALAMAFGGLRNPGDNYSFSHRWFLNFNEDQESDSFIVFKKKNECSSEGLDAPSAAFAKGLLPLDHYARFDDLMAGLYNKVHYPNGDLPAPEILEARRANLTNFCGSFQRYQIPIAELPETIKLEEVCEIFEVLNTSGTKVSTFDLIHNMIFGDTAAVFNLRESFKTLMDGPGTLSFLCSDSRREFLCQTVTACYLTGDSPKGRSDGQITSIKSKDLLETPTDFYVTFFSNLDTVEEYAKDIFENVLSSDFNLNDIPYPVSLALYFALRWKLNFTSHPPPYLKQELNKVFKAFFWRNALTNRYDQGILATFPRDLKFLQSLLLRLTPYRNSAQWTKEANEGLKSHFGSSHEALSHSQLKDHLLNSDVAGALKQAIVLFLYSQTKRDIISQKPLNRFSSEKQEKVDLHHIYPRNWCINNKGLSEIVRSTDGAVSNCLANLIPLSSASNNKWRTKAPSTAIKDFGLVFNDRRSLFEMGFIDDKCFGFLSSPSLDPLSFWKQRSELISATLCDLQFVH